jgi:hypothetical protein
MQHQKIFIFIFLIIANKKNQRVLQKKNGKNNQGVLKDSERTIMRKKNKSEK